MNSVIAATTTTSGSIIARESFLRRRKDGGGASPGGMVTVVDSGTTDTFLPETLARAWEESWLRQTGRSWTTQRTAWYNRDEFESLPNVTFYLASSQRNITNTGSFPWIIPPAHYMEATSVETKQQASAALEQAYLTWGPGKATRRREFTNRIYVNEPGDGAVLGLNAQRGHDILYDAENHRIGLTPVLSCVGDDVPDEGAEVA
jgi:hypothetical protein